MTSHTGPYLLRFIILAVLGACALSSPAIADAPDPTKPCPQIVDPFSNVHQLANQTQQIAAPPNTFKGPLKQSDLTPNPCLNVPADKRATAQTPSYTVGSAAEASFKDALSCEWGRIEGTGDFVKQTVEGIWSTIVLAVKISPPGEVISNIPQTYKDVKQLIDAVETGTVSQLEQQQKDAEIAKRNAILQALKSAPAKLYDMAENEVAEFKCMNPAAQSEFVCKWGQDIGLNIVTLIGIGGSSGASAASKTSDALKATEDAGFVIESTNLMTNAGELIEVTQDVFKGAQITRDTSAGIEYTTQGGRIFVRSIATGKEYEIPASNAELFAKAKAALEAVKLPPPEIAPVTPPVKPLVTAPVLAKVDDSVLREVAGDERVLDAHGPPHGNQPPLPRYPSLFGKLSDGKPPVLEEHPEGAVLSLPMIEDLQKLDGLDSTARQMGVRTAAIKDFGVHLSDSQAMAVLSLYDTTVRVSSLGLDAQKLQDAMLAIIVKAAE